jgi:hypothetical protein
MVNAEGKCLICMPDHSMDKDGACSPNTVPPEECDPETDPTCSANLMRMAFTLFLAFFLVRFF